MNSLQQQARFDRFIEEFNTERPHQALCLRCPAELYAASLRPYRGLSDLTYPHRPIAELVPEQFARVEVGVSRTDNPPVNILALIGDLGHGILVGESSAERPPTGPRAR
jgi:hypothetical protein